MNITVFCNNAFPISATFIYKQVMALSAAHTVNVITLESSNDDFFPLGDVKKWEVKSYYGLVDRIIFFFQKKVHEAAYKFSPLASRKLKNFIQRSQTDALHIHYGTWAVHLLPVLKELKIPIIVSFHGYDASPASKAKPWYRSQLPSLFDLASHIIIVSDHMREVLSLGPWENKVTLIPYGIDPDRFKRTSILSHEKGIRILHAGRIAEKKGVPDLIRVFAAVRQRYPDMSLHVLGDGPERSTCMMLIEQLNLQSSVVMYGARPSDEVARLMNECQIFVLNSRIAPSGDMEGFPNALLEAMSMEMAVVSTRHAGIPMAIKDHDNGLLVPEKDNEALSRALEELLQDADLRKRMGSAARKTVLQKFTAGQMNEKLLNIFDALQSGNILKKT